MGGEKQDASRAFSRFLRSFLSHLIRAAPSARVPYLAAFLWHLIRAAPSARVPYLAAFLWRLIRAAPSARVPYLASILWSCTADSAGPRWGAFRICRGISRRGEKSRHFGFDSDGEPLHCRPPRVPSIRVFSPCPIQSSHRRYRRWSSHPVTRCDLLSIPVVSPACPFGPVRWFAPIPSAFARFSILIAFPPRE